MIRYDNTMLTSQGLKHNKSSFWLMLRDLCGCGWDLPDVVTEESRLMENASLPHVLPGSLQLENLALAINRSFLCSRLGDVLLRCPFQREPTVSSGVG